MFGHVVNYGVPPGYVTNKGHSQLFIVNPIKGRKEGSIMANGKIKKEVKAQENTQAVEVTQENTQAVEVVETAMVDAIEGFSGMIGEVDLEKVEKVEDFSGVVPCVTVKTKDKDIRITDRRFVSAITRMRNAGKASKGIDLVLMGNAVQMKADGFVEKYHLKNAESIFKFIGLEVSTQKAQKLIKVGEAFVTMKDGVPVLDHRLPNLPLFTLDYLTSFVEVDEDGNKDFTKLGDFISTYGIGDQSTQKEVKDAVKQYKIDNGLADKESEEDKDKDGEKKTTGEKAKATTRGEKLAQVVEAIENVKAYFTTYNEAIMDEGTTEECYTTILESIDTIAGAIEVEKAHRENDLNSKDEKDADKWTK